MAMAETQSKFKTNSQVAAMVSAIILNMRWQQKLRKPKKSFFLWQFVSKKNKEKNLKK